MSEERSLPKSRLGRLVRLAGLGARTGASLIGSKSGDAAAERALEVLGSLRGLAAKVGQMASYIDGMVPPAHQAAYERALSTLRDAAPSSSPEQVRRVIEEDLGSPVDESFAEWEEEPFASASIGQVHEARLHDGRRVAVKVQHPGIDAAVEADLENAAMIQGFVRVLGPAKLNTKEIMHELKTRFREELDYRLEARRQQEFARLHAGDASIRVPAVIAERSGRRVLTSEFVTGKTLEQAADAPNELRAEYARVLWRFVFGGNLIGGMFNADPHPGNYVFHDDGSVSFLDFGCIQPIEPDEQQKARDLHIAALNRQEAEFVKHACRLLRTQGGSYEAAAVAYTRRCFEPLFSAPFHITRPYVVELVDGVREMKKFVFARDKSFVPLPPGMLFMNRLQFGFYSVLARLDTECDYATEERRMLGRAGLLP